ncbi:MAG: hypothetical protein PW786_09915 [Arachidicoccus sp.]|nr:hypothetical protein [Arachidicoccus sp.]
MKKLNIKLTIKSTVAVFGIALFTTGCQSLMYAQDADGTYPIDTTDNGYNYDYNNGYNEAPPPEQDPGTYSYGTEDQNYQENTSSEPTITYDDFYTQLSPYGQWVNDPSYGRVWVPNVSSFQPYSTNGYWSYTNFGWTWISNYAWGWAPFHYGRWGRGSRGWFWVPGYSWGPAWVAWSSGSDVYGWAPLAPGLRFSVGISINSIPADYWTFMPSRYMGTRNIYNYYVPRSRNTVIIRNTKIINNYGTVNGGKRRYTMGPQRQEVERVTGRTFQPTRVVTARDPKSALSERTINASRNTTNTNRTPAGNVSGNVNRRNPESNSVTQRQSNNESERNNTQINTNPAVRQTTTQPVSRQAAPINNTPRTNMQQSTQSARSYTETQMYRPAVRPSTHTRPVQSRSAAPSRSSAPARSSAPRERK